MAYIVGSSEGIRKSLFSLYTYLHVKLYIYGCFWTKKTYEHTHIPMHIHTYIINVIVNVNKIITFLVVLYLSFDNKLDVGN